MADAPSSIADIQTWFKERGFGLAFRAEDGRYWADLVSLATQAVLAPRYGGGESDIAAANRARARFEQEQ